MIVEVVIGGHRGDEEMHLQEGAAKRWKEKLKEEKEGEK